MTSSYVAGTEVEVNYIIYKCKPYPYAYYCTLPDFKPDQYKENSLWSDAWEVIGPCRLPSESLSKGPTTDKPTTSPSSSPTTVKPSSSPSTSPPTSRPSKPSSAPTTLPTTSKPASYTPTVDLPVNPAKEKVPDRRFVSNLWYYFEHFIIVIPILFYLVCDNHPHIIRLSGHSYLQQRKVSHQVIWVIMKVWVMYWDLDSEQTFNSFLT